MKSKRLTNNSGCKLLQSYFKLFIFSTSKVRAADIGPAEYRPRFDVFYIPGSDSKSDISRSLQSQHRLP